MEIKITYNLIEKDEIEVKAKFKNQELLISKNSDKWNNNGINEFLVFIVSSIPLDSEPLTVQYDDKFDNEVYKHICSLFIDFAQEFNKSNKSS